MLEGDAFLAERIAEVGRLRARIDEEALCSFASSLNDGHGCSIEHPPAWGPGALMGGANYHARIHFDNVTWLVRIPRADGNDLSIPSWLVGHLVRSEYATLKFLETTKVPAPRAFGYGLSSDPGNAIGVSFLLMEEMPGKVWNGQGSLGKRDADDDDRARVWNDLADILIELRRHPFPEAGSLEFQSSRAESPFTVSGVASDRLLVLGNLGPYHTEMDYFNGFVDEMLSLIADGQLHTAYPIDAYLVFSFLKESIPTLVESSSEQDKFYLKHIDDKGDHLMVDDNLNITGIIDWQMARIVPASEAFGPSLITASMADIYDGNSSLTRDDLVLAQKLRDKGAHDLAGIMSGTEKLRRFFFGIQRNMPWEEALQMVRGIWTAFGSDKDMDWQVWKEEALQAHAGDLRLQELQVRLAAAGP
ncbi:MAG: hypothetical protein M1837_007422 [Sclerophora amabilis]|nr:MAG: hypothetical protein M1837_007422 [Sclerophora amabilis]